MEPYDDSALAYDVLHEVRGLDHEGGAAAVVALVRARNPAASSLLDVACGTGRHLEYLRHSFDVEGLDRSEDMAAIAEGRLPGVCIHRDDMRTFDLGRSFDVVTCLFSSIGYLLTDEDLIQGLRSMANHLAPAGVMVIEPWIHPETWTGSSVRAECGSIGEHSVTRVARSWNEGALTHIDMHWSLGTVEGIGSFVEHHVLVLRSVEEYVAAFRAVGLTVAHDPEGLSGRGLFVATVA